MGKNWLERTSPLSPRSSFFTDWPPVSSIFVQQMSRNVALETSSQCKNFMHKLFIDGSRKLAGKICLAFPTDHLRFSGGFLTFLTDHRRISSSCCIAKVCLAFSTGHLNPLSGRCSRTGRLNTWYSPYPNTGGSHTNFPLFWNLLLRTAWWGTGRWRRGRRLCCHLLLAGLRLVDFV